MKSSPSSPEQTDKSFKEYMEARLQETLSEAKRHYQSYLDIRDQYNSFLQGRINKTFTALLESSQTATSSQKTSPINTLKHQKLQQDLLQTLKVNLQAQQEQLEEEREKQSQALERVLG